MSAACHVVLPGDMRVAAACGHCDECMTPLAINVLQAREAHGFTGESHCTKACEFAKPEVGTNGIYCGMHGFIPASCGNPGTDQW